VTPEYLVSLYEMHVGREADALASPHFGRLLRVSGRVGDMVGNGRLLIVRFDRRASPSAVRIEMWFHGRAGDRVIRSTRDVTVVGSIYGVTRSQITLDHCTLESDANRRAPADLV